MDHKIQGGYNITDIKQWPFIGYYSVMNPKVNLRRACSGIVVDQFTAITAGHCTLINEDDKPYRLLPLQQFKTSFVMGVAEYTDVGNPTYQKRDIIKLFIHPKAKYNAGDPIRDRYDIGAMKWEKKVILNDKIQLIPLIPERLIPDQVFRDLIEQRSQCEMAGWGALYVSWTDPNKEMPKTTMLQGLKIDMIPINVCCETYFKYAILQSRCMQMLGMPVSGHLCHIRRIVNTSIAQGDSGSPIYCPYKGKKYVVGMNVAGDLYRDPPPQGPVDVFVPSYFVIDEVLRSYITEIKGNASGLSDRSERNGGSLNALQFFAIFTWSLL